DPARSHAAPDDADSARPDHAARDEHPAGRAPADFHAAPAHAHETGRAPADDRAAPAARPEADNDGAQSAGSEDRHPGKRLVRRLPRLPADAVPDRFARAAAVPRAAAPAAAAGSHEQSES